MFIFRKTWRALFSCCLRFKIHPFVLLPTNYTTNYAMRFTIRVTFRNISPYLNSWLSYSRQLVLSKVHSSRCHRLQLLSMKAPKRLGAGINPRKRTKICWKPNAKEPCPSGTTLSKTYASFINTFFLTEMRFNYETYLSGISSKTHPPTLTWKMMILKVMEGSLVLKTTLFVYHLCSSLTQSLPLFILLTHFANRSIDSILSTRWCKTWSIQKCVQGKMCKFFTQGKQWCFWNGSVKA